MFLVFALILLIALTLIKRQVSEKTFFKILAICILLLLIPVLLPRKMFGSWNSISSLNEKNISKIILVPSAPNSKINLVSSMQIINNKKEIDSILALLRTTEIYFHNRRFSVWQTKLIFVMANNDSLGLEIHKKDDNETVVYTENDEWRKDEVGVYLETITKFRKPFYGDTLTSQ